MKYRLLKDETLILKAVPHKYAAVPDIILSAVIVAVSFVLKHGVWGIIAAAILLGTKLFRIFGNGITITDRNLILKKRTLKSYEFSIPLSDIKNIQIEQGMFGKIFGYGTVIVILKYKTFSVKYIKSASIMDKKIMYQVYAYRYEDACNQVKIAKNSME